VHDRVLADRKFYIDAAIVKTLKSRKEIKHQVLVTEVIGLVRFPLEVSQLLKRIEFLIDDEYMRRDEDFASNNIYHYIAWWFSLSRT